MFFRERGTHQQCDPLYCRGQEKKSLDWYRWGGIYRFDGSGFTVFNTKHGVPHNNVRSAYIDRSGKLWIGTSKGLAYLGNNKFVQYAENEALSKSIINVIRIRVQEIRF